MTNRNTSSSEERFDPQAGAAALLATSVAFCVIGCWAAACVWAVGYILGLPVVATAILGVPVAVALLYAAWLFLSCGYRSEKHMRSPDT